MCMPFLFSPPRNPRKKRLYVWNALSNLGDKVGDDGWDVRVCYTAGGTPGEGPSMSNVPKVCDVRRDVM